MWRVEKIGKEELVEEEHSRDNHRVENVGCLVHRNIARKAAQERESRSEGQQVEVGNLTQCSHHRFHELDILCLLGSRNLRGS